MPVVVAGFKQAANNVLVEHWYVLLYSANIS